MKKLGNLDVCGVEYTIVEIDDDDRDPDGMAPEHVGFSDHRACRIFVRDVPKERRNEVLFHEAVHCVLWESGIERWLAGLTRLSGERLDDAVEDFVTLFSPGLRTTLRGLS